MGREISLFSDYPHGENAIINHCGILFQLSFLLGISLVLATSASATKDLGVRITQQSDRLRIEINGKLFTEYLFKDVARPYCYPIIGPEDLPMTRNWPMRQAAGEERDHKHHRSFWYAHGAVNGMDFWSEEKRHCKTVHEEFLAIESGKESGLIKSRNKWIGTNGVVVCADERALRIYNRPDNERLFDFEITLKAPADREVVFGDTKEGTMATRIAETMRLTHGKDQPGKGHIVLSTGVTDKAAWGQRADWCDYYGPVEGQTVGIAIFDHPSNPRHPTWWHVRDYGLFAANPFGLHDFENKPAEAGNLTIPAGKSVTFRYRFYLHQGDDKQARVADHYRDYAAGNVPGKN